MPRRKVASEEADPILFDDLDSPGESDEPQDFAPVDREPSAKPDDDQHLVANDESEELEIIHDLEEERGPVEEEEDRDSGFEDQELLSLDDDLRRIAKADRDLAFQLQDERNDHADLLMQQEQMIKGQRQQQLQAVDNRLRELPDEITKIKNELKRAKEEGDTEAEVEALDHFYKLRNEAELAQLARNQLAQVVDEPIQRPQRAAVRQAPTSGPTKMVPQNQLASEFIKRNPWIGQSRYANESARLQTIDQAMANEGLDPTKPDYYREMDRRLRAHFPNLPRQGAAAARPASKARSPVAAAPRGVVASREDTPTRVRLTRDSIENMRRFQMNPKDPQVRAQYAREKFALDRAEKARGK